MSESATVTDYDMSVLSNLIYLKRSYENETVGDLIRSYQTNIGQDSDNNWLRDQFSESKTPKSVDSKQYEDYVKLLNKPDLSKYDNWKIIDIVDKNDASKSGLYAYTIQAGDSKIIVFRGSEDPKNNINDWKSDFDLIDQTQTEQQKDATDYLSHLEKDKGLGEDGQKIYITGHSLGGNLAMYSAITSSDTIKNNLQKCDSFNGPGFNFMFMKQNMGNIGKEKSKITAFQNEYDLTSSLLNYPVDPTIIKSNGTIWHDTYNHAVCMFKLDSKDETGFAKTQDKYYVYNAAHDLTLALQFVDPKILDQIKTKLLYLEQNQDNPELQKKFEAIALGVFRSNPIGSTAIALVGVTLGLDIASNFLECYRIKQQITDAINRLPGEIDVICKTFKATGSQIQSFVESISHACQNAAENAGNFFNSVLNSFAESVGHASQNAAENAEDFFKSVYNSFSTPHTPSSFRSGVFSVNISNFESAAAKLRQASSTIDDAMNAIQSMANVDSLRYSDYRRLIKRLRDVQTRINNCSNWTTVSSGKLRTCERSVMNLFNNTISR